jgi:hypothetical protein
LYNVETTDSVRGDGVSAVTATATSYPSRDVRAVGDNDEEPSIARPELLASDDGVVRTGDAQ